MGKSRSIGVLKNKVSKTTEQTPEFFGKNATLKHSRLVELRALAREQKKQSGK